MARYIDADKALDRIYDIGAFYEEGREVKDEAVEIIADFPAADVQEVKHAKYYGETNTISYSCKICSNCDLYTPLAEYCIWCGAKMDREDKENDRNKH